MGVAWDTLIEIVNSNQSFLLTSHIRPDCDALGSELGFAAVLESLGKEVTIVNGQETPPNLSFIDPEQKIKALGKDIDADDLPAIDVLAVLDTSAFAQLGPMADVVRSTNARKIILDHHVDTGDDLGATPLKDVEAEATGRLVVEAAEHLGVELTPAMAKPLYAAIATDTGWFRFNSTTSTTYCVAAKLVDAGANPAEIYALLYEQESLGRLKLRGRILERLVAELDGRLIHTFVLKADFPELGAVPSDTEDAINLSLTVAGTEAAVILVELNSGGFKISFRSQSQLDCQVLAAQFGGGGHKAAAGAWIDGPLEAAQANVLDAVRVAMR